MYSIYTYMNSMGICGHCGTVQNLLRSVGEGSRWGKVRIRRKKEEENREEEG